MPVYEMPLLLKTMSKPQMIEVLKRTAEGIFQTGGFIKKIDNLGKQPTPWKMMDNQIAHREAHYFIFHFFAPPAKLESLRKEYNRDVDILKVTILTSEDVKSVKKCTLHEELLPPMYRPDVQKMLEIGAKQKAKTEKHKFKFNTGLDYYPFQR
ncbi:probable 28S ribosomal protein S6, mitochondrial [Copidosoma floridanum]|uniref:probable 28S ribosomal protein S6, mitochondrial n=1 Tax=Copidosoma floridanum TaxID=29053 RepID=UPI0006C96C6A|nr:probable 28S ribosomal protein S6, mitochondrial [Copidosoma floridanum]